MKLKGKTYAEYLMADRSITGHRHLMPPGAQPPKAPGDLGLGFTYMPKRDSDSVQRTIRDSVRSNIRLNTFIRTGVVSAIRKGR